MSHKTQLIIAVVFLCFFITIKSFSQVEPFIDTPFFDDFDAPEVNTAVWQVASWKEHGGQTSPERCYVEDGYLKLFFINDSNKGFLNAAIQTRKEFLYGTWEARIKPSHLSGILNSFYTIDWNNYADRSSSSNGTKQEIDIEFLTYTFSEQTGKVHYATHEHDKKSFETNPNISVDFNPSDDFHVWGFTTTPEYIEWFVDDIPLQKYIYTDGGTAITAPYQLKLNIWTSENWINGPPIADVVCEYLIDWIRFTPLNTTSTPKERIQSVENQFLVYPNPVTDQATVKFYLKESSNVDIYIYSIEGKLIYQDNLGFLSSGNQISILNNAGLNSGLYFISINTEYDQRKLPIMWF